MYEADSISLLQAQLLGLVPSNICRPAVELTTCYAEPPLAEADQKRRRRRFCQEQFSVGQGVLVYDPQYRSIDQDQAHGYVDLRINLLTGPHSWVQRLLALLEPQQAGTLYLLHQERVWIFDQCVLSFVQKTLVFGTMTVCDRLGIHCRPRRVVPLAN